MKKLLTSLIISLFLFTSYGNVLAYQDVPDDSPYFYAIDYLRRNDVFKDTKEFKPDVVISRAEFIKYLVILNSPDFKAEAKIKLPFKDTRDTAWYAAYFSEAIKLGILSDRDVYAYPDKKLDLVNALQLLFHSQSIPIPKVYKGSVPYTDLERNKTYAPLIMRAMEFDLMQPQKEDFVGIYRRVTRAEAAMMIYKMDLVNLNSPSSTDSITNLDYDLQKIISVWDTIQSGYVYKDKIDNTKLADSAIKGMVDSLGDPYSTYLDEQSNAAFSDDLDGEIEGIGAYIEMNDKNEIVIVSPIQGSPAESAGVKAGDIIIKVGDTDVAGMSLYDVVAMIKGPKGTTVKLEVKRGSETVVIDIVRDVVKIKSVNYEVVDSGKAMLITISQFSQNTADDFAEVVEIIQKNADIKGVIIDVRNDPGGLLDSVVSILNHMLKDESEIVTIAYSYFKYTQYAKGGGEISGYPMVVLINKGSASAAEILAGALKDYGAATIVGETSFGKGSVQEMNYFSDDSSLKLTVAKWLTPLGNSIDKNGITPDIAVTDNPDTSDDEQMATALTEINRLINK